MRCCIKPFLYFNNGLNPDFGMLNEPFDTKNLSYKIETFYCVFTHKKRLE